MWVRSGTAHSVAALALMCSDCFCIRITGGDRGCRPLIQKMRVAPPRRSQHRAAHSVKACSKHFERARRSQGLCVRNEGSWRRTYRMAIPCCIRRSLRTGLRHCPMSWRISLRDLRRPCRPPCLEPRYCIFLNAYWLHMSLVYPCDENHGSKVFSLPPLGVALRSPAALFYLRLCPRRCQPVVVAREVPELAKETSLAIYPPDRPAVGLTKEFLRR
jgi:hypothetical protein